MKQDLNSNLSQISLLKQFFKANPNRDIHHPEIVDWAVKEYKQRTGKVFRDPDRGIRKLHQQGFLIKISKGVYRYDPAQATDKSIKLFSAKQKQIIFKRDNYKCVVCGLGLKSGVELHADHIKPLDLGGRSIISNGQTLCSQHNMLKKNLNQTETGKKMFIHLYELAKRENNISLQSFCADVLKIYDKHNMNGHIDWTE